MLLECNCPSYEGGLGSEGRVLHTNTPPLPPPPPPPLFAMSARDVGRDPLTVMTPVWG